MRGSYQQGKWGSHAMQLVMCHARNRRATALCKRCSQIATVMVTCVSACQHLRSTTPLKPRRRIKFPVLYKQQRSWYRRNTNQRTQRSQRSATSDRAATLSTLEYYSRERQWSHRVTGSASARSETRAEHVSTEIGAAGQRSRGRSCLEDNDMCREWTSKKMCRT